MKTIWLLRLAVLSFLPILFFGFACGYSYSKNSPKQIQKLTILEAEEKFPVEILSPTIGELQQHANRHGYDCIEDNIYGPETARQLKSLRCDQMCSLIMEKMTKEK